MSERKPRSLITPFVYLGHAAWFGMRLAGIAPAQALLSLVAFSAWFAVLVWGCVLPTLRKARVIT